jgi:hypothetical protein
MVYYAYFHSVISYGVIFWGNSSYVINIFHLQKRVVRIITGIGNRNSYRQIFTALKMLPLSSLYIYSLLHFVVDDMDQYYFVSDVHNRDTRQVKLSPYRPWRPLRLREVEAPQFSDIRLIDGGKVVSPMCRPLFTPREIPHQGFKPATFRLVE